MQEFYRAEDQPVSGVVNREVPGFVTSAAGGDAAIRRRLEAARSVARAGDPRGARLLCADLVLEHQLRLHDNRDLLGVAVAALVHARGFQLLGRLLQAVDGRHVRISLAPAKAGAASPPHPIRRSVLEGIEVFAIEESLFTDPSCDAIIDRWSRRLVEAGGSTMEPVAA